MDIVNKIADIFRPKRLFFRWFTLTDILGIVVIAFFTYVIFIDIGVPKDMSIFDLTGYWLIVGLWLMSWVPNLLSRSDKKLCQQVALALNVLIVCLLVWGFATFFPGFLKRVLLVNVDHFPDSFVSETIHVQQTPFPFAINEVIDCIPSVVKEKESGLYALCDDKVYRIVIDK